MSDHGGPSGDEGLDTTADHLYGLPPDEFVPARDDAVARARERGERDLAQAIGCLRRPTRAAWLSNLLARRRGEQLDGLITLAGDLAAAQRTLDGDALRALSVQRHRLVAAMAREAGQLARQLGEPVTEPVLRELHGILEAALADPGVAAEVRYGRLIRTVTYSGFGPATDPDSIPNPATRPSGGGEARRDPAPDTADPDAVDPDEAERQDRRRLEQERRAREQWELEHQRRERDLRTAEQVEAAAVERQRAAASAREAAEAAHDAARERVVELAAELEHAQQQERTVAGQRRAATAAAKESARAASAASTRTARARARLDEHPPTP